MSGARGAPTPLPAMLHHARQTGSRNNPSFLSNQLQLPVELRPSKGWVCRDASHRVDASNACIVDHALHHDDRIHSILGDVQDWPLRLWPTTSRSRWIWQPWESRIVEDRKSWKSPRVLGPCRCQSRVIDEPLMLIQGHPTIGPVAHIVGRGCRREDIP